ncbi:hypothetical protein GCM10010464_61090 [Pseudonocardia yunnanensis]|uniref:Uncharacterized protein n=1 Tax=Pseudonocardia yunnanensis TaxID=58107 RepID=A0ABW4EN13_9PSEU
MVRAGSGRREASRKDFRPWLWRDAGEQPVSDADADADADVAPEPEPVAPDAGLSLVRLLSIARLTPVQAVALATDIFAELEKRRGDRGDAGPIPLRIETVHVAADGHAYLVEDKAPVPVKDSAADAVLDELTAAAWRPTTDSERPTTGPVATLDRAAAEARLPEASISGVVSLLREADTASGSEARNELARMVSAVNGGALAPPHPPVTSAPPIALRPPDPERPPRSLARLLAGRTWKWVLSVIVLVTVVVIEVALLRDTITRDIDAVLDAGRAGSAAPTSTQVFLPVAPAAPTAAGTVTGVDLRAVNQCTPDAECAVRLQVALQPTAEPQTVTWGFQVFDRCTGATTTAPGGEVTVPPDGDRAVAVVDVTLPPGEALAVLARTDLPSIAASAPVFVPSDASCGTPAAEPSG